MQYQKGLKFVLIIGLIVVLLVTGQLTIPMGLKSRVVILFSKYRALMPYIIAQAKLESGNFTSRVFKTDKNYFGMKLPVKRPTVAAGPGLMSPEGNNYAHYNSESDSVTDLLLWMEYTKFPTSVNDSQEYTRELKSRNYFGVSETVYIKNINYWLNKT